MIPLPGLSASLRIFVSNGSIDFSAPTRRSAIDLDGDIEVRDVAAREECSVEALDSLESIRG